MESQTEDNGVLLGWWDSMIYPSISSTFFQRILPQYHFIAPFPFSCGSFLPCGTQLHPLGTDGIFWKMPVEPTQRVHAKTREKFPSPTENSSKQVALANHLEIPLPWPHFLLESRAPFKNPLKFLTFCW